MSINYSADLKSRVEPCIFGGTPDCSQCGCAISVGLHRVRKLKVADPLGIGHFISGSICVGLLVNRLRRQVVNPARWRPAAKPKEKGFVLMQICS